MADNSAGLGLRLKFVFGLALVVCIAFVVALVRCSYYAMTFRWNVPCEQCGNHTLKHFFDAILHSYVHRYVVGFEMGARRSGAYTLREVTAVIAPTMEALHKAKKYH